MKKTISVILIVVLALTAVFANGATETVSSESVFEAGQKMSDAELLALAKAETGDFIVYGNTSRIANAVTGFIAKYGAELGLNANNAVGSKMNDADIYTTLLQEYMGSSNKIASVVMIQDGAQLKTYRNGTDILVNYVPKACEGVLEAGDKDPLVHQYIN